MKKIAVIGTGNMGMAIASSLSGMENVELVCTAKSETTLHRVSEELPAAKAERDNRLAATGADIILLAVKPYVVRGVIDEIRDCLSPSAVIASVVAGLTVAELSSALDAEKKNLQIFRVIPNTAIRYRESVTFISHSPRCEEETVREIERLFSLSGATFIVPEKDMAACTSLASCGIAFFLRFIRAAAEGGVELGLPAAFATKVAALTARGAAALLKDGAHPESEVDKVTTPGGLTIRGLNAMEAHGFTTAVIEGLKASCLG